MLVDLALQSGAQPYRAATIALVPDETIGQHSARVLAVAAEEAGDKTDVYHPVDMSPLKALHELDAFLIVNGKRHVSLNKPLTTIGRRVDNDIIIDSPAVSRRSADS